MCKTCHVPLCNKCILNLVKGPHAKHELENTQDTVIDLQKDLSEITKNIKKFDVTSTEVYVAIGHDDNDYKDDAIVKAKAKGERVIAETVEWTNKTVKEINAAHEESTRQLQLKQDDLLSIKRGMHKSIEQIQRCLDDVDIENGKKKLDALRKCLEENKAKIPVARHMPFGQMSEEHILDLGQFKYSSPSMIIDGK